MIRGCKEPVFKKNDNYSLLHFKFNPTLRVTFGQNSTYGTTGTVWWKKNCVKIPVWGV